MLGGNPKYPKGEKNPTPFLESFYVQLYQTVERVCSIDEVIKFFKEFQESSGAIGSSSVILPFAKYSILNEQNPKLLTELISKRILFLEATSSTVSRRIVEEYLTRNRIPQEEPI